MSTREVRMPDTESTGAKMADGHAEALPAHTAVAVPGSDIADPGPLGLGAFAMTTFVLSCFNADIISNPGLKSVVLPLALFYGGIAQLLAGMWEFKKNNTFGATAFTSYGAFWLAYAAYAKYVAPPLAKAPATAKDVHTATGLFLLAWTIFTAYMLIAALRVNGAVALVFAVLVVTFILLAWGDFAENESIAKIGGYLGIVTALLAWYASMAGVVNSTWKRVVFPVMPVKS